MVWDSQELSSITLEENDIVAPHLWDWSFDGVDDYIKVLDSDSLDILDAISIEVYMKIRSYPSELGSWIGKKKGYRPHMDTSGGVDMRVRLSDSTVALTGFVYPGLDNFFHYVGTFERNNTIALYINTVKEKEVTAPNLSLENNVGYPIYIGADYLGRYFNCSIAFVRIYNRSLTSSEISQNYNQHIINASQLVLFLDPTFYNGTVYKDLTTYGNDGTPYNGVQRVEAENKFLWQVKSLETDNKVHFKYFPYGTKIKLYNSGMLVDSFNITGTKGYMHTVYDYTYNLTQTVDQVTARVPFPNIALRLTG